jgi:Mg2+ and Co2+ transporter CorA
VAVDLNALLQTLLPLAMVAWAIALFMRKTPATPLPADSRLIEMIDRLQQELNEVKAELREMQDWAARLSAQVISMGGRPVTLTDIENASRSSSAIHRLSNDKAKLIDILKNEFSIDELELIASEIGAPGGTLGVGDVDEHVSKMINYATRKGKLMDVAFAVWRERPDSARK